MKRLTKQEYIDKPSSIRHEYLPSYIGIYGKLAEYENVGLTPEEIHKLIKYKELMLADMATLGTVLNEYIEAEEQGLLLRLPCKVGDTVYIPETDDNARVHSIDIYIRTYAGTYRASDFGKTIFATRAAEEALKGEQFKKQQNDCIDAGYVCYRSNCEGCTSEALKGGEWE